MLHPTPQNSRSNPLELGNSIPIAWLSHKRFDLQKFREGLSQIKKKKHPTQKPWQTIDEKGVQNPNYHVGGGGSSGVAETGLVNHSNSSRTSNTGRNLSYLSQLSQRRKPDFFGELWKIPTRGAPAKSGSRRAGWGNTVSGSGKGIRMYCGKTGVNCAKAGWVEQQRLVAKQFWIVRKSRVAKWQRSGLYMTVQYEWEGSAKVEEVLRFLRFFAGRGLEGPARDSIYEDPPELLEKQIPAERVYWLTRHEYNPYDQTGSFHSASKLDSFFFTLGMLSVTNGELQISRVSAKTVTHEVVPYAFV